MNNDVKITRFKLVERSRRMFINVMNVETEKDYIAIGTHVSLNSDGYFRVYADNRTILRLPVESLYVVGIYPYSAGKEASVREYPPIVNIEGEKAR